MNRKKISAGFIGFLLLLGAVLWMSCTVADKNQMAIAKHFIACLNQGQLKQARALTDSQFYVVYRFEYSRKEGDAYLTAFQPKLKFHPNIKIESVRSFRDSVWIDAANTNDYSRILKIGPRKTRFVFGFAGNKISSMHIDTLPGFDRYRIKNDQCWTDYMRWVQEQDAKMLDTLKQDWYSNKSKQWLNRYAASRK